MGFKTISLADDAYERLAAEKHAGESFSDVVRRLTGKRSLRDLVGLLSPREANALAEAVDLNKHERIRARYERLGEPMDTGPEPERKRRA
ncbi:MAG: antitoxin VapB family protein [Methanobacteriota archaeon]